MSRGWKLGETITADPDRLCKVIGVLVAHLKRGAQGLGAALVEVFTLATVAGERTLCAHQVSRTPWCARI